MSYAIIRTGKIKSGGAIASMGKHQEREQKTPNADPEKTTGNILLIGEEKESYMDAWKRAVEGKKIRANAVLGIEVILTYSPEAKLDEKGKLSGWAYDNIQYLKEQFGEKNILKARLHVDETTPHIHAFVVPIDEKGKLNCRHFLGGADKLHRLQDSYAAAMRPYGLERGMEHSKAEHTEIKEFYGIIKQKDIILPEPKLWEFASTYKDKLLKDGTLQAFENKAKLLEKELKNTLKYNSNEKIREINTFRLEYENKKMKEIINKHKDALEADGVQFKTREPDTKEKARKDREM